MLWARSPLAKKREKVDGSQSAGTVTRFKAQLVGVEPNRGSIRVAPFARTVLPIHDS